MATKATAKLPARPAETIDSDAMRRADVETWLARLRELADAGNAEACRQITEVYDELGFWTKLTGLRYAAEEAWLDLRTERTNLFTRKVLQRELERKRADLLGADPSPLERILVERIGACWLACQHADRLQAVKVKAGLSLKEAEYLGRQVERANRSLLRAVKTLATVRKLMQPTVQINLAEQQINVAK
jgi:hypothetical protein